MAYDATHQRLDALTDHVAFEELVVHLLARLGIDIQPTGGPGDRGRDAVAGLYRAQGGEPLMVTISLDRSWEPKIRSDIERIVSGDLRPETVIAVTNRLTGEAGRSRLQDVAASHGIDLTIRDRRWLVPQLHVRDNLELRGRYLNLGTPELRFFLDLSEYETLLVKRRVLDSHFAGRVDDMDRLEVLLGTEGSAVILEAPGGFGKTRLGFEHARSGRSETPWFFVGADLDFESTYLAETEAGYDVTVLIDDAHRRSDLRRLLAALERREPRPRLVLTVRPGHAAVVESTLNQLAFRRSQTLRLQPIRRSELVEILRSEPYEITRDGMLSQILAISEGNVGVALIAASFVASGGDPTDLSQSDILAEHVQWRLAGAGLDDRENRAVMALVAAVGTLDLGRSAEASAVAALLEDSALNRRLDLLADAGVIVEDLPRRFTIKPDIVREHSLRSSFFPDSGRPVLRYARVYEAFAESHLPLLLRGLGEARVDLASGADPSLDTVRSDLFQMLERAESVSELVTVAELVRALGAGGANTGIDVAERVIARMDVLDSQDYESVGRVLAEALATAKFGRDQLPRAWRLTLRLARLACERGARETRDSTLAQIREIYSAVPMNYSSADPYILTYVQRVVADETGTWWDGERELADAERVAAAVIGPAFTMQLETHRQAPGNAMAIQLLAGFLPASPETEAVVRLGVRLFTETFLVLSPTEQLVALEAMDDLGRVAGGYPGAFSTHPSPELQALATTVLAELEEWLSAQIHELTLPVAGGVMSHFAVRGRRARGAVRVPRPRPWATLRDYVALVDHRPMGPWRRDWMREMDERRERARRYGRRLARAREPLALLDQWNQWIDEHESLTGNLANSVAFDAALGELASIDAQLARELAEHAIENELSIARFTDSMLTTLVADPSTWPLVERWSHDESSRIRVAAVQAAARAPDRLAQPVLTALVVDADPAVARQAFNALTYRYDGQPLGWRLDAALRGIEESDDPLDAVQGLLTLARHRSRGERRVSLTTEQKRTVRRIVLGTAATDDVPRRDELSSALTELEQACLDLALPWLTTRLEYVRQNGATRFVSPLPDELGPIVRARRHRSGARRELARLLDEIESPSTEGLYLGAVSQAIEWLGGDSRAVTTKVAEWIRGDVRARELAFRFLRSGNWSIYTQRAKLALDAHPHDAQLHRRLYAGMHPSSWIGSLEPYFRERAKEYGRWVRSSDPRLRAIGVEAVAHYERLADEAVEDERRMREQL